MTGARRGRGQTAPNPAEAKPSQTILTIPPPPPVLSTVAAPPTLHPEGAPCLLSGSDTMIKAGRWYVTIKLKLNIFRCVKDKHILRFDSAILHELSGLRWYTQM